MLHKIICYFMQISQKQYFNKAAIWKNVSWNSYWRKVVRVFHFTSLLHRPYLQSNYHVEGKSFCRWSRTWTGEPHEGDRSKNSEILGNWIIQTNHTTNELRKRVFWSNKVHNFFVLFFRVVWSFAPFWQDHWRGQLVWAATWTACRPVSDVIKSWGEGVSLVPGTPLAASVKKKKQYVRWYRALIMGYIMW